jgi:hypothetical protein
VLVRLHALFTRRWGSTGHDYPSGFVGVVGIIILPMMSVMIVPPSYGAEFVWPNCLLVYTLAVLHGFANHRQKAFHPCGLLLLGRTSMTYCISIDEYWLVICMALGITIVCLMVNTAVNLANTIHRFEGNR